MHYFLSSIFPSFYIFPPISFLAPSGNWPLPHLTFNEAEKKHKICAWFGPITREKAHGTAHDCHDEYKYYLNHTLISSATCKWMKLAHSLRTPYHARFYKPFEMKWKHIFCMWMHFTLFSMRILLMHSHASWWWWACIVLEFLVMDLHAFWCFRWMSHSRIWFHVEQGGISYEWFNIQQHVFHL